MAMMIGSMRDVMTQVGSAIAGIMVAYAMFQNYFPSELCRPFKRYYQKLHNFFYPYIQISFPEHDGDGFERSAYFSAIQRYLNSNSTKQAKCLKADVGGHSESIVLTMDDYEEVTDDYNGIRLWWASNHILPDRQPISFYPRKDEKREFTLTFHMRHRNAITNLYLRHVLDEGKAIAVKERQRKLFTNIKSEDWDGSYQSMWSHVLFDHPATFDTLAMDPHKKREIIDDLINFTKSKDYYAKIGKPWKRGYLLHGPPGTGKSTMIAAMANLLKYDVYDLELTAVKNNTKLRKLLIDIGSKSIVVIEDIDCSLDLTGQRKKKSGKDEEDEAGKDPVEDVMKKTEETKTSQVTLSGLLNFVDGLWSSCGGERIIVFTTNYVEKLDPALIRRGRMDKHIELSYCSFEAFKVLARNYLDLESHKLFASVRQLLEETKMTPADVAENLMPKSGDEDEETCLKRLIEALEDKRRTARVKAMEEEEKQKEVDQKSGKENEEKGNGSESAVAAAAAGYIGDQNVANGVKENGEAIRDAAAADEPKRME